MEMLYISMVVILFALAISDLVVGVSNDAVNFLNSAVGAKAATFKTIMLIAAAGVLAGTLFSSGMMEVARKGIFNPSGFAFSEIMIIFLAVMFTDVVLLDLFNTFGMPTSTTVSIVFELLGAAVCVALLKIIAGGMPISEMASYINTSKALLIISGILLSVAVAFTVGALVQWISRLLFSFRQDRKLPFLDAIWGGIAVTAITYFILIKGIKGSSLADLPIAGTDLKHWVSEHAQLVILGGFVCWTILLQGLHSLAGLNIMKFTVLLGTFALAMAFAGNDLVNFIGVPLAGYHSFRAFSESGVADPGTYAMSELAGKVPTPTAFLLLAGVVMVLTLLLSRKAKTVVMTSLNLSRQAEGDERFGSSLLARSIVRGATQLDNQVKSFLPSSLNRFIEGRFDQTTYLQKQQQLGKDAPMFDMVRASVNLFVASILISIATSYKLPLSTTYVTFMVAMGTSLSDRAWGRESAVYRITGVLSVIGGWFFTAFSAFSAAFIVAGLLSKGGVFMLIVLLALVVLVVIHTHQKHARNETRAAEENQRFIDEDGGEIHHSRVQEACADAVSEILEKSGKHYKAILDALTHEDVKQFKQTIDQISTLNARTKVLKNNVITTIYRLRDDSVETGHYYVQVLDYLREIAHCLEYIAAPCFEHVNNSHKGLSATQLEGLKKVQHQVLELISLIADEVSESRFEVGPAVKAQRTILATLTELRKEQIKQIKKKETKTRNAMLFFTILHETKDLALYLVNLLKAQRDFMMHGIKDVDDAN